MLRKLLMAFGAIEILKPRPIISACERIGLENSEELRLRSWVEPAARLLGVLYLLVVYLSSREE